MSRSLLVLLASILLSYPLQGQESRKIPISFLPPPLETATYSLGIYNAKSGQLVRRLQEGATQDAFTVGLNGLITNWDGKDDAGKTVPPGKYAARGYAVGALKVEGVDILGNDWAKDDETLRVEQVEAVALIPEDEGAAVVVYLGNMDWRVLRFAGSDGRLLWYSKPKLGASAAQVNDKLFPHSVLEVRGDKLEVTTMGSMSRYRIADGEEIASPHVQVAPRLAAPAKQNPTPSNDELFNTETPRPIKPATQSPGKDGTTWKIDDGVLLQSSPTGEILRSLIPKPAEPVSVSVSASIKSDQLYLLERMDGWQRVRGLRWIETKQENGKSVSTWQTFFERNIRPPDPVLGLDEPGALVEASLVENPLDPGKPQKVKLQAKVDEAGSYLVAADGLRLRRISQRANLKAAKLAKGKSANDLIFFQYDGAAWDEFSIEGAKNIMAFDAGEIDMTADGERTHPEKAAEPPDL